MNARGILWRILTVAVLAAGRPVSAQPSQRDAKAPIALSKGVHLFLDDELIAKSIGIDRKVTPPVRTLPWLPAR